LSIQQDAFSLRLVNIIHLKIKITVEIVGLDAKDAMMIMNIISDNQSNVTLENSTIHVHICQKMSHNKKIDANLHIWIFHQYDNITNSNSLKWMHSMQIDTLFHSGYSQRNWSIENQMMVIPIMSCSSCMTFLNSDY